ncbi:MAG: YCF48-related protein [bacterium]
MKTKIIRLLIVVVLLITGFSYLDAQWEACNGKPLEGLVNGAAIHGNTIYACTNKGIYVSGDEGRSWDVRNNGLTNLNVYTLFINDNKIYAGTWGGGIFVYDSDSLKWKQNNTGLKNLYIYALECYSDNILAGTKDGIFVLSDNSLTWTNAGLSKKSVYSIAVKNNIIFAGTGGSGVFISEDNGITWTVKNTGLEDLSIYSLCVVDNIIIAGTGSGVYISKDNGEIWEAKNNGLSNLIIMAVAAHEDRIYAGTSGGGIFVSTDNGNSWTERNNGITDLYIEKITIKDNNTIAVTRQGKIFTSKDFGDIWSEELNNVKKINNYINVIISKSHIIYAGGNNSRIYISTDLGRSWSEKIIDTISTTVMSMTTMKNNIYAGTNSGVFISRDSGNCNVWERKKPGKYLTSYVEEIVFLGNFLLAGTRDHGIYLSTDDGESWTQKKIDMSNNHITSMATSGNDIFTAVDGWGIFLSSDNGDNWIAKNNGLDKDIHVLNIFDDSIIAANNSNGLYLSNDYGDYWTKLDTELLINSHINTIASYGRNVFVGGVNGIFLSTNGGNNWISISDGLNYKDIRVISFSDSNVFIANAKGEIFRSKLSDLIVSAEEEPQFNEDSVFEIYPNPATDFIKINLFDYFDSIELYSTLGLKVLETKYQDKIDISTLPSGMYFLKAGDKVYKFIKI